MKIWNIILATILTISLVAVAIGFNNIDKETASLRQKVMVTETSIESAKKEQKELEKDLKEASDKNTALEEKLKITEEIFASVIKTTEGKLISSMKDIRIETEIKAEEVKNKTAELEKSKADKEELVMVGSVLIGDIINQEKRLEKKIAGIEDKIFDPAKIYEKVKKAVVEIESGVGVGTGILLKEKNRVITTYHIIKAPPGTRVKILPNDGGPYKEILGTVKKIRPEWDLAEIELIIPLNAEPLMPADIKNLKKGESVLAIGNPKNLPNSISPGWVNGINRRPTTLVSAAMIQVDPVTIGGFSGGPLVNSKGEVVGVISLGIGDFSFAIPIDYVMKFLEVP